MKTEIENVKKIIDMLQNRVKEVEAENKKLKTALGYYADSKNARDFVLIDKGFIAKQGLKL